MIKDFKVKSGFAANLPCLKGRFTFTKGLNVLFGPNGCGKSTTLKIIAAYCGIRTTGSMGCGGWSRFPDPMDLRRDFDDKIKLPAALKNMSPGKCEAKVGWDGTASFLNHSMEDRPQGSALFDSAEESNDGMTDMMEQIGVMVSRPSSGQLRLHEIGKIVKAALNPPDLTKIPDKDVNINWSGAWNAFATYVKTLERTGPVTLLLDEPDKSLSIESQIYLWKHLFPKMTNKVQLIVATHSPFSVDIEANFVDMQEGYLEETRKAIREFYSG